MGDPSQFNWAAGVTPGSRQLKMASQRNRLDATRSMQQALRFREQKRAQQVQEQQAQQRMAEVQRSSMAREQFNEDREFTRAAEADREVRLQALKQARGLTEAGRFEAAKKLLGEAGFDTGKKGIRNKETLTKAGKDLAKQVDKDRELAAKSRQREEQAQKTMRETAAVSREESAKEEAEKKPVAPAKGEGPFDPTTQIGAQEKASLDSFINQQAASARMDPQIMGMGMPAQMMATPQQAPQPPPVAGLAGPPPGMGRMQVPAQMQQAQQRPQAPAGPQRQMAPDPGMAMAMGAPQAPNLELMKLQADMFKEQQATQREKNIVQVLKGMSDAVPERDRAATEAFIGQAGWLARSFKNEKEALEFVASKEGAEAIRDRAQKDRESLESTRRTRLGSGRSGDNQSDMRYERGQSNAEQLIKTTKVEWLRERRANMGSSLTGLLSNNPKAQAQAIVLMAGESMKGVLSDEDFNRIGGRKSVIERGVDGMTEFFKGEESQRNIKEYIGVVEQKIRENDKLQDKAKRAIHRGIEGAYGRDHDRGEGWQKVYERVYDEDWDPDQFSDTVSEDLQTDAQAGEVIADEDESYYDHAVGDPKPGSDPTMSKYGL